MIKWVSSRAYETRKTARPSGRQLTSADRRFWVEHGYDFADGVIEVDHEFGADVLRECRINADLQELNGNQTKALMVGCDRRVREQ